MTRPLQLRFLLIALALVAAAVWWPEAAWLACPLLFMPVLRECTTYWFDEVFGNLAGDYTSSGTWTVISQEVIGSTTNGTLIANTGYPAGATGVHVTGTMYHGAATARGRLVFGYVDSSNYWFAEVESGATNGTLKLFQRTGGVNTQREATQTVTGGSTGSVFTVCGSIGSGIVAAAAGVGANPSATVGWAASPTVASTKAGFGTGAVITGNVFCDQLRIKEHYVDYSSCSSCYWDLVPGSGVVQDCASCDDPLDDLADLGPEQWAVTIADVVVGPGSHCNPPPGGQSCSAWNGTFILNPNTGATIGAQAGCQWFKTVSGLCGVPAILEPTILCLTIFSSGGNYFARLGYFNATGGLHSPYWEKNYGATKPQCLRLSSESLTMVSAGSHCQTTTAAIIDPVL